MKAQYQKITRFVVRAECVRPLHIGNGGIGEEILFKGNTGQPFIQGTSLAGVCSSYIEACKGKDIAEQYFGSKTNDTKSRIIFSEGKFQPGRVNIEMRTRVRIDGATSTVEKREMKGGYGSSGQLMDVEYISEGSFFAFSICALDDARSIAWECLAALNAGIITIGGKSTIGCGQVRLASAMRREYDMADETDRHDWGILNLAIMEEDSLLKKGFHNIIDALTESSYNNPYYEIEAGIRLRTPMLIKANFIKRNAVERALQTKAVDRLPDNMSITDGNDEFIIPGSSLKGIFRSRMETICRYVGLSVEKAERAFEDKSDCIFSDALIKSEQDGMDDALLQPRIHINKISGFVMNKQRLTEAVIGGHSVLQIKVLKKTKDGGLSPEAVIGLVLFVLRDMELGTVTIGSGAGIGRGFVSVEGVKIRTGGEVCELDFHKADETMLESFVERCLQAVKGGGV